MTEKESRYVFRASAAPLTEIGPGDMAHIPAGYEHRHRTSAIGDEPVRYFITEFE